MVQIPNLYSMLDRIKKLEETARRLEPAASEREEVRRQTDRYSENFLQELDKLPAYVKDAAADGERYEYPIGEDPLPVDKVLGVLHRYVDTPGLNPASGGHLGYIPGGGVYYAALGDYLAAVTNRYAGYFFASPGAVRLENAMVRWMCDLAGYPSTAAGNLTSGGSLASLTAIVTARDSRQITSRNIRKSVIYLTAETHHSIGKDLRIAGLSECMLRKVAMDEQYRMDPGALERLIGEDLAAGRHPWLVIATAGTTNTGAVDPLDRIAGIASRYGLWCHVDAAYGGFFLLTARGRELLKGIERSDSLVMDPHKGLFLPYGSGAVLVKDGQALARSQHWEAGYMSEATEGRERSPADLSPELSRHFRGLRMWLPLQLCGLAPFRAALEEKLLLAQYFYREIKKAGFATGPAPDLSVVLYRYIPFKAKTKEAANRFNEKLLEAVYEDGRVFISGTVLDDTYWLRLAVLSFRTHLEHVQLLLQLLKERTAAFPPPSH